MNIKINKIEKNKNKIMNFLLKIFMQLKIKKFEKFEKLNEKIN